MNIKELYKLYTEHHSLTTDSRDCPEGSIFIALKGDKFDGNQYAAAALSQGCAYAVVDDPSVVDGDRYILVDNALQTLKDLAREHRRQFQIPVIAITGTNGKTTTKELIAAVLSRKYNVLYTQGNFNNDVGVPKTLLRLTAEHDIAVIEMGASHPGDIRTLAETAEPTCGLITNVGRAHLEGFGSFKNVVKTKGELYDYLGRRGESLVFINADNERLLDMLPDTVWVAPYSSNPANVGDCTCGEVLSMHNPQSSMVNLQSSIFNLQSSMYLRFRWRESDSNLEDKNESPQWYEVQSKLIGSYNVDNMMAAIAVGLNFGVEPVDINAALESYSPTNNRSQLMVTEHNQLVVDAYNANPTSMSAALENFGQISASPKMAILGQMNELGNSARKEHQKIVDLIATLGLDEVWLVGAEFAAVCGSETNPATGATCRYRTFTDVEAVKDAIHNCQPQGYSILIKGSNSTRLYQLPQLL